MTADVGLLDRGTAIRVCPIVGADPVHRAKQCNVEFRVADATASPYLALAMLVQAGLEGICQRRESNLNDPRPLPTSLSETLYLLEASDAAKEWLGSDLHSGYLHFKRAELKGLADIDEVEICRRYREVY